MAPDASSPEPPQRTAIISRNTKETRIHLLLSIDGGKIDLPSDVPANGSPNRSNNHAFQVTDSQYIDIETGIGFLDHMLHALAKHAGWSLYLRTKGDLVIDDHHTTEDTFLALGSAFHASLTTHPTASLGLHRFFHAYAPLDEALSRAIVDLSARPYAVIDLGLTREKIGDLSCEMVWHALESFAINGRFTVHLDCLRGSNDHHRVESAFKALALALRGAASRRTGTGAGELASTKGLLY